MSLDWISLVVRTSLLLCITGCVVYVLTRRFPLTNPKWHRLAWTIVLLQGLMLFQFSLSVARPAWLQADVTELPSPLPTVVVDDIADRRVERDDNSNPSIAMNDGQAGHGLADEHESIMPAVDDESTIEVETNRNDEPVTAYDEVSIAASSDVASTDSSTANEKDSREATVTSFPVVGPTRSTQPPTDAAAPLRWTTLLQWTWLGGMSVVVVVLALRYFALHLALMQCRPARRSWSREMHELCHELGLNHPVPLHVHNSLGPLLCWTPRGHRVVVPVGLWNQFDAAQRTAVLHHELCHLRRGDLWKSLIARIVVAIHWFNPLAWLSAKRFDESAEWSCDALMARESPGRITRLASALLAVSEVQDPVPLLAASATGGPMFQRIRRLLSWNTQGDSLMPKCVWSCLLIVFVVAGSTRLEFAGTQSLLADDETGTDAAANSDAGLSGSIETVAAAPDEAAIGDPRLIEIADRIIVGDNDTLRQFVELVHTPTGQIVMADRAAVAAQYAEYEQDEVSLWDQFVANHFEQRSGTWFVKADQTEACQSYVDSVKAGANDLGEVAGVFHLVASQLDETHPKAAVLKRLLEHESMPALIYEEELGWRLHPGVEDVAEIFNDHLVRTQTGTYVIRPARRSIVERRLAFVDQLGPTLRRFQEELAAWQEELSQTDEAHRRFADILGNPAFAQYIVFNHIYDESQPSDEDLDGMFWTLEEATHDTASGLMLDTGSEQYQELLEEMERFSIIWDYREELGVPLRELANLIEDQDELHTAWSDFLTSDLALMGIAREMEYLPVSPEEAVREWLGYFVTQNEEGLYEITIASEEELEYFLENHFYQLREIRRRGRRVDEFAAGLADPELAAAMQSFPGKLLLAEFVERTAVRPDVDGLQVWIDQHFEESVDGLVLYDWAGEEINEVLEEAAAIEDELSNNDF